MSSLPTVGVSACLLGKLVRYAGDHRRCAWVVEELPRHARIVAFCPEVGCGMGTPREPIELVGEPAAPGLRTVHTHQNRLEQLEAWIAVEQEHLAAEAPVAFVLKARSPSCGVCGTPVWDESHEVVSRGPGLWTRALQARFAEAPCRTEEDLASASGRAELLAHLAQCGE